ncbi:MAG: response regulator [Gemmatimonadetes bacterium]|nr:response regulator [Gemmatimonadota bacterium]
MQIGESLEIEAKGQANAQGKSETAPVADVPREEVVPANEAPPDPSPPSLSIPLESATLSGKGATETIRISAAKLDALLRQVEEMLSAKLTASQRAADLKGLNGMLARWKKEWARAATEVRAVRQALKSEREEEGQMRGAPQMDSLLEFMDWNGGQIGLLEDELRTLATASERDRREVGGMVDQLLEEMKQVLMHPFATFAEGFPRMVREIAREQGKEVELTLEGEKMEIDRRILEEMKDPLIHLLRNAVDHGIEVPEVREQKGKPRRGKVTVALSQVSGSRVEMLIADDGAGIDLEEMKKVAAERGIVSTEQAKALGDEEALALIYQADVSTSRFITDISGRGLGMAIVREKVEGLGGSLLVENRPGEGTAFRLLLPLSLANFRGVLVEAAGQIFIIPTANVEQVVRVSREEIRTVENRETISLNGSAVSLVRLADLLELSRSGQDADAAALLPVLVLGKGAERIAFEVERVISEQVVLVKGLGPQLSRVQNVAGATVLGTGQVVSILNATDLLKSAVKGSGAPVRPAAGSVAEGGGNAVLVAEDSITSRMLLKNILEAAGYRVKTAVDGLEALTELKAEPYDLVVSDVEMPRMDGFKLTESIRANKKLGELPVVLVTALASREHRERGIDVGANAYIVKSSFDQSNLLETVDRFI